MGLKEIVMLGIFCIFVLPLVFKVVAWSADIGHNSTQEMGEEAGELLTEAAIPWWLGILEWLVGLPGLFGAMLGLGFIMFLKWIKEI